MKLFKTTFYSGIIAVLRLSAGFISTKIIAMLIGAAGVAVVGSFANLITIVLSFGNGAIGNGVVKYVAEYKSDERKSNLVIANALKISIFCSVFFGGIIFFGAHYISKLIFSVNDYINPIRALGGTLIFYSLNSIFISILNGKGQINKYTSVNTIGTVVGLIITCILVYFFKVEGALYALVLSQSMIFFITLLLISKEPWVSFDFLKAKLDKAILKDFSHFTLMALVTAVTIPISQLWLRNMVTDKFGIDDAGIWQGMMRISDAYLMVVSLALSTYYLPKLSSLKYKFEIKKEIYKGYLILTPTIILGCIVIFSLKHFIIELLYTKEFQKMADLFFWQLVGDFFKILSYLLAFLMLAKRKTILYIVTEILFSLLYVLSGYYFTENYGLIGITMAFSITYAIYFLIMIVSFYSYLKNIKIEEV
ncbi:O-antigen translocase [uncultured Chryseobacterium sp.]|uniref:O-antigen translocase n=1 Tax=uncultured Chryseobacterium sp. TaxID=259322 RepID=UPI0025DC95EB|nr:O-antigen translocase [uncultured Chryseobacterium sp.]